MLRENNTLPDIAEPAMPNNPAPDRPMPVESAVTEWAWRLIREVVPTVNRATGCLYFATAAAAALGAGWRFQAGGAMLPSSGITGWGLSVSPRDKVYHVTADFSVSIEDGSFCGHCWVQGSSNSFSPVVDIMEGYYGPRQKPEQFIVYHAVPSLTQSIREHYAAQFTALRRRVKRDKDFIQAMQIVAQTARDETWANA